MCCQKLYRISRVRIRRSNLYPTRHFTLDDLILESVYGEILIGAGFPRPNSDHHAHHIIPRGDARAEALRQKLHDAGIDINDPTNLIWLPKNEDVDNPLGRTPHSQTYTNDYFNYLDEKFKNATEEEFPSILEGIRRDLENGIKFRNGVPRG